MTENTSANNDKAQGAGDMKQRYVDIGATLRKQREALSLSQKDVAHRLHLPGIVINDIETGQIEQLSSIYRRGYIRNYAQALDLDPEALLADAGEDTPPVLKEAFPVTPQREWQFEKYLKIATYAIVTVAIIPPLVYFFIAGGMRILERDPAAGSTSEVVQSDTTPEHSRGGDVGNAGGVGNTGEAPEQIATRKPEESARHVSASAIPLQPIRPVSEDLAVPKDFASDQQTSGEAADEVEAADQLSALHIELLDDSWIEIHDAEGERLEYDLLRSGQTRNYEAQAPFQLLLGRSSAIELHIDGKKVTWEGHESGDVAEIAIAADGSVKQ